MDIKNLNNNFNKIRNTIGVFALVSTIGWTSIGLMKWRKSTPDSYDSSVLYTVIDNDVKTKDTAGLSHYNNFCY